MSLLIDDLMLGDVHTISIPTDAIFIVSILIILALLGYSFNNILSKKTNQLIQKIDVDSNFELVKKKLENQLAPEITKVDQKPKENPSIKKLSFLPSSRFLALGSLSIITIGGASLLGMQSMQKSYEGMRTSQANIQLDKQFIKSYLAIVDLKSLDKPKSNINRYSYSDSYLSSTKSSKDNYNYQVKEKLIENNFSF